MPRVLVVSEPVDGRRRRSPTLNEHISPIHMADEHSSLQFLERLAWAISDAEESEQAAVGRSGRRASPAPGQARVGTLVN